MKTRTTKLPRTEEIELRAIRANAGLKQWYQSQLQCLIESMARSMLLHIQAVYPEVHDIGFGVDADPIVALRRAMTKWGKRWTRNLNNASDRIAAMFAGRAQKNLDTAFMQALRDAGFVVKFKPTAAITQAYRAVIAENVNLIRSIPQKFLTDVQSSVWESVMKGGKLKELTRGLKKTYGVTWRRAELIARDQNNKAKAIMEEARRNELGIDQATWQHSHAGKIARPTHVAMHGKRYDIAKGMYDPAVKKFVWPGSEINCRCSSRSLIPGIEH